MNIEQMMIEDVARVRAGDRLRKAAELMDERSCGFVPVVDEEERVVGVLTDRDVCMVALRTDQPLSSIVVADVMRTDVHTCRPTDSISHAERIMAHYRVRRLPILDEDCRLVGVLSIDDIAREAAGEQDLSGAPVSMHSVGKTLGKITEQLPSDGLPLT